MVIYHSPSASHGDFMRFLEDTIEELIIKGKCMVTGDFNIDLMMFRFKQIANDNVKLRYKTIC